jgi:eukaryotic-like serine/threonine-protein kinase
MQLAAGVSAGDVLAGKYLVERVLGVGGMGVVVAAHHMQLDEKVAIKFLLPEMLGHAEAVSRFAREARAAVKIKSEHVARVLDVGTLETGAPYMVMEFLDGGDLGAWLEQRGALPIEQAVEFVLQASIAVAEAHSLGIVHRDLKPANLFCVRGADGRLIIKVLDFGISKMTNMGNSAPGSFTHTSAMMGSPYYMSPEQMRSPKDVDARTDIWALGVVLYELLTKSVPFQGDTQAEVCVKIVTEPPPPVRDFRPDVPEGLQAVILTCLEKDRKKRYRNIAEMAVAMLPFGPRQSRATVEKVIGIIQAAGLSATAVSVPVTPVAGLAHPSGHTIAPVGHTVLDSSRRKVAVLGSSRRKIAVLSMVGVLGVASAAAVIGLRVQRGGVHGVGSSTPVVAAGHPPADTAAPPAPIPPPSPVAERPVIAPIVEPQVAVPVLKSDPVPLTSSLAPSRTAPRTLPKAAPKVPAAVVSPPPPAAAPPPPPAAAAPAAPASAAAPPASPVPPSVSNPIPSDPLQNLRIKR